MTKLNPLWLCLLLIGCGQYPNPNDLASVQPEHRVEIANKRLEAAETTLQYKVGVSHEISDGRRNQLIQELAEDMLKSVDPKVIPESDLWMYAALLRVTNRWAEAETALVAAVKVAKTEDRRVNDTLKLAQAQAKNAKVTEAISTANSVLNVADGDAAPVLPAILYEVVPAAQGKGHDKDLADLLVKAIDCHRRVKVDLNSDAGKLFVAASRHHIDMAQLKIEQLSGTKI